MSNRFPPVTLYDGDPTGVACSVPNSIAQSTASGELYSCVGGVWVPVGGGGGSGNALSIGFTLGSGAPGSGVGPILIAPHAGMLTKCRVVTKASDPATALSFQVLRNGAGIFGTPPSVPAATASGTVSTFAAPLPVADGDLFSLNILTGTSSWYVTIQLQ